MTIKLINRKWKMNINNKIFNHMTKITWQRIKMM